MVYLEDVGANSYKPNQPRMEREEITNTLQMAFGNSQTSKKSKLLLTSQEIKEIGHLLKENLPPRPASKIFPATLQTLTQPAKEQPKTAQNLGKRDNPIDLSEWKMNEEPLPKNPQEISQEMLRKPAKKQDLIQPSVSLKESHLRMLEGISIPKPTNSRKPLKVFQQAHTSDMLMEEFPEEEPEVTEPVEETYWITPSVRRDLIRLLNVTISQEYGTEQTNIFWYGVTFLDYRIGKKDILPGDAEKAITDCIERAKSRCLEDELEIAKSQLLHKRSSTHLPSFVGELSLPQGQTPWGILRTWSSKLGIKQELLTVGEMLAELSLTDPWLAKSPAKIIAAGCLGVMLSFRGEKEKHDITQVSALTKLSCRTLVITTIRVTLLMSGDPEPQLCPIRVKFGLENLQISLARRSENRQSNLPRQEVPPK